MSKTKSVPVGEHFADFIERQVQAGRYDSATEVVRAGLRILDAEERAWSAATYPPGSLRHLGTRER